MPDTDHADFVFEILQGDKVVKTTDPAPFVTAQRQATYWAIDLSQQSTEKVTIRPRVIRADRRMSIRTSFAS